MTFKIETEPYGNCHTRERVTLNKHLVTFFGDRTSADKFVYYCETHDIRCRRDWIKLASPEVKQRYLLANHGGGDLAVTPFTE